ncbi:MAG: hypothetical protein AAB225_16830 [Acidobacteriota bacterium]
MTSKFRLILGLLAVALVAFPQSTPRLNADIPFEFYVGGTVLPAGQYQMDQMGTAGTLAVRSFENKAAAVVLAQPARSRSVESQSRLIFNKYGDTYFLAQIWRAGTNEGISLKRSKRERELARVIGTVEVATVAAGR